MCGNPPKPFKIALIVIFNYYNAELLAAESEYVCTRRKDEATEMGFQCNCILLFLLPQIRSSSTYASSFLFWKKILHRQCKKKWIWTPY